MGISSYASQVFVFKAKILNLSSQNQNTKKSWNNL